MAHATLEKFGYPATLVRDYGHWCVLLRPHQATLGALVLVNKSEARSFAGLEPDAYAELATITRAIEDGLTGFRPFAKINYLMLMMADPHVHFHVLPRYAEAQIFDGATFEDAGWPGAPNLGGGVKPAEKLLRAILETLRAAWPA